MVARWRPLLRTSTLALAAGGALAVAPMVSSFTPLRQPIGLWGPLLVVGGGLAAGWSTRVAGGRTTAAVATAAAVAVFVTVPDTELITSVGAAMAVALAATVVGWVAPPTEVVAALGGAAVALAGIGGSAGWTHVLVAVAAIMALMAAPALTPFAWQRLGLGRVRTPGSLATTLVVASAMLAAGRFGGVRTDVTTAAVVAVAALAAAMTGLGLLGRRR
ncbi:MAG: hypothetical protein JJU45_10315 [Acidimicrobiia bacterium]|nr:hypothetical protein [Acidimicrobiia bacterium]